MGGGQLASACLLVIQYIEYMHPFNRFLVYAKYSTHNYSSLDLDLDLARFGGSFSYVPL